LLHKAYVLNHLELSEAAEIKHDGIADIFKDALCPEQSATVNSRMKEPGRLYENELAKRAALHTCIE
jgi:hypothetical protein